MDKLLLFLCYFLQFSAGLPPSIQKNHSDKMTAVQSFSNTPCEDIEIDMTEKTMTVKNLVAPHSHVDVYKVDKNNGWKNIFACNDNCGQQVNVNVESKQHYIVHIKLFSKEWELICERQMTLDATNNQTTCDDVSVVLDDDIMTVRNLTAPHQNVEVYQIEQGGGWTKVQGCNDCSDDFKTKVNPKQKHIIHVKMFNKQWGQICDKQIDYQPGQ